ncbi:uncharacterized protein EI90DRAFT_3023283 [Cantharellus anzutake]|uniref:uncharacterized protein n=1 Tax=Cantharellus anzutake TaxID=1750568 RepID=UPI0019076CB6|nr:uncharacterized protein EI90DRAFT_3023283 [Cantharellus anzutake]KAF8312037.1 hypothetical protein EI90DRAFT_3023283 [Cantharellus anzutake]
MSASPSSTTFQSRGFQVPSSSTPVQPSPTDLPINTDEVDDNQLVGDANNGSDSEDPTPGDASTIKSIEAAITKYAALYAILYSPFLTKGSLMAELDSDFHSWAPATVFLSVGNFNQFCVHKVFEMKYPILTKELSDQSGAMPCVPVLKSGHGPTPEQLQEYLGVNPDSANPIDHLPLFLFPDNDQSHCQHVFCSQIVAACYNKAIIVLVFGPSALIVPVSSIPLPGSPELEDWEPAKGCASQKALGITYEVTEIMPGTLAIVSMLVYFILSGDTEMASGSGKPSATNYVNILLNLYGFSFTVLQ